MEDVLRKIYLRKHQELEKKKLQRRLSIDEPQKRQRKYKNVFQDYLPLTQTFDLETELQIKKQIHFGNDFLQQQHRYKVKSVTSPFQQKPVSFPPIKAHQQNLPATEYMTEEELIMQLKNPQRFKARQRQIETQLRRKYVVKRFRIRLLVITFVMRLNSMRKKTLLSNRQSTRLIAASLLQTIDKMVNKYYANVLEEQLLKYLELIKIKIKQPQIMLEKQIVNMLYFMTKKLADSAIVKELMTFLLAISRNGSFFPSDYLTEVEATRLQFDMKCGCLRNVQSKQRKMIIAVCVGLKIFCGYILYRPWLLQMEKSPISPQEIINNFTSVVKIIHGTASVFYYIIMENYCDNLELIQELKSGAFKKMNLQFQQFVNIFPKEYEVKIIANPRQIFPNQKKKLFMTLSKENPEMFADIRQNIITWIDRIDKACLKEAHQNDIERRQKIKEEQREIIRYVVGKAKLPSKKQDEEQPHESGFTKSTKNQKFFTSKG